MPTPTLCPAATPTGYAAARRLFEAYARSLSLPRCSQRFDRERTRYADAP